MPKMRKRTRRKSFKGVHARIRRTPKPGGSKWTSGRGGRQ